MAIFESYIVRIELRITSYSIPDIDEEIVAQDVDMKDNFWSFGGCPYLPSNNILRQEHDMQHIDESHGDIILPVYMMRQKSQSFLLQLTCE